MLRKPKGSHRADQVPSRRTLIEAILGVFSCGGSLRRPGFPRPCCGERASRGERPTVRSPSPNGRRRAKSSPSGQPLYTCSVSALVPGPHSWKRRFSRSRSQGPVLIHASKRTDRWLPATHLHPLFFSCGRHPVQPHSPIAHDNEHVPEAPDVFERTLLNYDQIRLDPVDDSAAGVARSPRLQRWLDPFRARFPLRF